MKKPTNTRLLFVVLIFLQSFITISQNRKDFTTRFDTRLKGDMLLIGNSILNRDSGQGARPGDAYNGNGYNSDFNMKYIDIDNDPTTFSSSSATLTIPKPKCYKIVYAGLYWSSILQQDDRTGIDKIKIKLPTGGYHDITGEVIYDAVSAPIGRENNKVYACYADITGLVTALTDAQGLYTIANVKSSEGTNGGTGLSAGWSIFVVYEDPTFPAKYITSFDGFSGIGGATTLDIPVSGFKTIPTGPVRVKFAFAALEGDQPISGDYLQINSSSVEAVNAANTVIRSKTNFFNSSVTYIDPATDKTENFVSRTPASTNTLGYDAGILHISNSSNAVIANNATSATIRLGSTQDVYFYYFNAFAVDIIEPKIVLTKIVKNEAGVDIGGQNVTLGQRLNYVVGFQNTGNDNAKQLTIRDRLPINTIFNYPEDLNLLPTGVTVQSYNPATRDIIFAIADNIVAIGDPKLEITFKVQVVPDCNSLSEACSNSIDNSAYATYKGTLNTDFFISDDPSVNTNTGCLLVPKATNFLVGIDGCRYTENVTLCKDNIDLVAANGYAEYTWYSDEAQTNQIGKGQTLNVSQPGTYYVYNLAPAPCRSIYQSFTVSRFGSTNTNPVIPYAQPPYKGEVLICPNDGKELPNLFLCGLNDSRLIQTSISDGATLVWEKLDEASCPPTTSPNCANENLSCSWTQVATGPDYNVRLAGQYRLTLNYAGGCFNRFYFNVFTNLLNPTETHKDLICNSNGNITIGGVSTGYEYSIDGTTYQSSNSFTITTPGLYTIYIKQVGVTTNPCIFTVPNIQIRKRDFTVSTIITEPLCNGDKGSIRLAANGVEPQYSFSIYSGTTLVNSVGPITSNDYSFSNLDPGKYNVKVTTQDGCSYDSEVEIKEPDVLKATVGLTKPITSCSDGEITIYPVGGTPPYSFFINSTTVFQGAPQYVVTASGTYNIDVVDYNNCKISTSINVTANAKPIYTITNTTIVCSGEKAQITVNVTDTNGYILEYSFDNGQTFGSNSVSPNLSSGTYNVVVRYTLSGSTCTDPAEVITIADPASPITASASVAELAGCTLSGQGGKLQITNTQGGTAPYEYSFDGGGTWQTSSEKDVLPGTYILKVRDAAGCVYTIPSSVILDPKPADPIIAVENPVFNCDGTATTTVTVTNSGDANYIYEYYLDNNPNTPISNNVFTNVSAGSHTISVKYSLVSGSALSCFPRKDFPIIIDSNKAFTASVVNVANVKCNGDASGSFSIVANNFDTTTGFQYSINGGSTWVTSTTSPVLVSGLGANTYDVRIRYDATSAICNFTFGPIITSPSALGIAAQVTTQPTCSTGATITATATGGTLPYDYELREADGITVVRAFQDSGVFTAVPPDTYTVVTRDINSCISSASAAVIVNMPTPPTASLATSSDLCYDAINKATLVVTASGTGTLTYSLDGAAAQTANTFTNVGVGVHSILVTDSNNCTITVSNIIIAPQLNANATITKTLDCTTLPNAIIKVAITDGTSPYTYRARLDAAPYDAVTNITGNTFDYSAATSGVYTFEIRDANSCLITVAATVSPITNPTVTASPTNISCNGLTNGEVRLVGSGGSGGYEYNFNNLGWATTTNYIGLGVGSYTYQVRDRNACLSTVQTISITAPTAVTGTISATVIKCGPTGTVPAVVTIVGLGGTGSYTYSFNGTSNFTSTNTYSTTTAGTVDVYIKDASSCQVGPFSIVVGALHPITGIDIVEHGYDCSTTPQGGHVTITALKSGSLENVIYQIISGPAGFDTTANATGDFVSLVPGDYIFKATATNTDCTFSISHTIIGTPEIVAGGSVGTNIKCFDETGTISFTVNGAKTNGYDYTITNESGTIVQQATAVPATTTTIVVATALPAGIYTITATDVLTQCEATYSITLTQPVAALDVTATATTVNCNKYSAIIDADATGGTINYTYAAVIQGAAAPIATAYGTNDKLTVNTDSGTILNWTVYVKDANGCIATVPISVLIDPVPTVTAVLNNQCSGSGDNFTITATGSGGIGSLTYSTSGVTGVFQSSTIFNVTAGTYTIWVKDQNGCTASTTPIVVAPQLIVTKVVKELDCSTTPDATITVTPSGGKAPYKYNISTDGGTTYVLMGSNVYATSTTGTYLIKVTDDNGCEFVTTTTIHAIGNPTLTFTKVDVSCNGGTNGSVQLFGADGAPGYIYSDDGITYSSISLFENLVAGNHTFYVKDTKECVGSILITIAEPTLLVAIASATTFMCSPTNTKQAAVVTIAVPTTGTAPYQYSFNGSGYTENNTLIVNDNGIDQTITYSVRDAKGCVTTIQNITINRLDPPIIASITSTPILCAPATSTTSTVTISTTNGVGALVYEILSGPVINTTGGTTGQFTGLIPGTYSFKVTDANGCYAIQSHTIDNVIPITVSESKLSNVLCFGGNTGAARFSITGFSTTENYTVVVTSVPAGLPYTMTAASDVITLNELVVGDYTLEVTDNTTNCIANKTISITEPASALDATIATINANCNISNSQVTVAATGGTPIYRYAFVPNGTPVTTYTNSNIAYLDPATTDWDVYVMDANGCTVQKDITITKDAEPTVTASAVGECFGDGTSFVITATSGVGVITPVRYSIDNGASFQSANTFTVTAPGNYTILIEDANRCSASSTVVTVFEKLTLSAQLDKEITCSAPIEAQITLTATNGNNASYTYTSSPTTGTFVGNIFSTNTPGSYTFTVTDANSCTATTTTPIVVNPTVTPVITNLSTTPLLCNGDANGSIAITIDTTQGLAPFVYNVLNTTTGVDYGEQTSGLTAGDYIIKVTDAKGCFVTQNISIAQPTVIVVSRNITPITCNVTNGISLGTITINSVTGGTPNYSYHVTGVNGYDQKFINQTGATAVFEVVDFGLYQIVITDANGCTNVEQNILIASPPDDLDITVTPPPADCSAPGSAVVAIGSGTGIVGNGPFHFAIYTGPGMTYTAPTTLPWHDEDAVGSKQTLIPNLIPGVKYTFIVHDSTTGCYYYETAEFAIPTNSTLTISNLVKQNITCKGAKDGKVSFTINSTYPIDTDVTYEVLNSLTLAPVTPVVAGSGIIAANGALTVTDLGPLPYGTYFVVVKEVGGSTHAGCSIATDNFIITESAIDLEVTASVTKNANCKPNSGVISAIASNGTAPYLYILLPDSAAAPVATDPAWANTNVFNTDTTVSTDFIVYAKDAYSCIKSFPITLTRDADPTITAPAASICYDGTDFQITYSGTVSKTPAMYSVNGSAFQTNPSFTFNTAGTYNLVIQDANGCTAAVDYVVYPQLQIKAAVTKQLDCSTSPEAEITLTATGGNTTPTASYVYTYSYNGGAFLATTNVHTTSDLGDYIFRVTDGNNTALCFADVAFKLEAIPSPIITTSKTNVSCNGSSDGTITVSTTSGVGPFEFSWNNGTISSPFQSSNKFTDLPLGSYVITVKDARSCLYPATVAVGITEPSVLTTTAMVTDFACNANNIAQAAVVTVVVPTTGTAPYKYNFDGSANYYDANTLSVIDNGTIQIIHYYVKDANGCLFDATILVNPYQKITDLSFANAPITCANATTAVTVNVAGGYTITKYEIIAPISKAVANGASNLFSGLEPDTYTFKVTDANGCSFAKSLEIKPVTNITASSQLIKNVSCNEMPSVPNGVISFTVANFTGGYTYAITPAPVPTNVTVVNNAGYDVITVTGLGVGSYTIDITDSVTDCVAAATIGVSQPAVSLSLSIVSNTSANCNFGARVTVEGHDGTPGYLYAFIDTNVTPTPDPSDYKISPSSVLDADPAKKWVAFVKDANDCIAQVALPLTTAPMPTIDPIMGVCYTGAPVNVTLTGTGVAPLQYNIGNGYTPDPNFTLEAPGTYTFYIKDANDCVVPTPYVYELKQELLLRADLTDLTCDGPASVILTATQGTTVYTTYEVSFNGGSYNPTTSPFTTSTPGTYIFRVTDSQGCQAVSTAVAVTPNETPTFAYKQADVSCNGGNNGSFTIIPGIGTAPFEYRVNGGSFQSTNIPYTGLIEATYNVEVRDVKNCLSVTQLISITDPDVLVVTPTVTPFGCDASNVSAAAVLTLAPAGGTPSGTGEYSYSFDNGVSFGSSPTKTVNTAQTINYVVVDANGCRVTGSKTIDSYTRPTDMDITATPIYCNTAGGVATVTVNSVTGGVAPYTYEIIYPVVAATSNATGIFNNLTPETYQIKVTDANGCSTTKSILVKKANEISVTAQLLSDVLCNGGATGSVAFTISNYINAAPAAYTYTLTPNVGTVSQTADIVTYTGLTQDNYTFDVEDLTSGCSASVSIMVREPAASLSFGTTQTNINCIDKTATITVNAVGGTPAYQYAAVISGAPTPTIFSNSNAIVVDTNNGVNLVWDVYAKDRNECSPTSQRVTILEDPLPAAAVVNPFSQCPDATNGSYTFTISGVTGVEPFQYSIGAGFQDSPTFIVNEAKTYTLTVKDANNCETQFLELVKIVPALDLQVAVTTLPSCTTNNGIIDATTTGGAIPANYEYSLDGNFGQPTGNFTGVAAGSHSIAVTDLTTGCNDIYAFNIPDATPVTGLALAHTAVTCKGAADGTITVTITPNAFGVNDNPVYTYTLMAGTTIVRAAQTSPVFLGLSPGDYEVIVTSGRDCSALEDVTIVEPDPIVVNAPVVTQFGCTTGTNAANFATITVNSVTGGSLNYRIYEFVKAGTIVQRGSSNVYTEVNLAGGSYVINVYDDKGCMGTAIAEITIAPLIRLDGILVNVDNAITCTSNENITVSAATTGGIPTTLLYSVEGINGTVYSVTNQPTGVFTGLGIGNYRITVTNPVTNCSIQEIYYINNPNTFGIKTIPVNTQICYGTADGSVDFIFVDNQLNPTDDTGAFNYIITGPSPSTTTITGTTTNAGPVTISNLTAGQYTVTATLINKPECVVSTGFAIEQPNAALLVTTSKADITCVAGNNDGIITAAASGGWKGDYQYELVLNGATIVAYSTQFEFTGLSAGNYRINARDSKGCINFSDEVLVVPVPITISASTNTTMLTCFGDKSATITANPPTGGQGNNYRYTLNTVSATPAIASGPQADPIFTGLGAGTYNIAVTDGFNCVATSTNIVINEPTEVKSYLVLSKSQTCFTQSELTLGATGGTAPYTYSTDANFASTIGSFASSVTFAVPVGQYQYYVKDADGCVGIVSNEIENPALEPLEVGLDITNAVVKCMGEATGVIVADAKGGLGNYIYSLQDAAGNLLQGPQASGRFENLLVGTYVIKVDSGDCNTTSTSVTITEPTTAIQATFVPTNISCFGENNGKIEVTASGGTGIIKYAISPDLNQFEEKTVFDKLLPGIYTLIAQDENGCYVIDDKVEIKEPNPLIAQEVPGSIIPELCEGDKNGAFSIEVIGGTAPFSVSLDAIAGTYTQGAVDQTQFDFTNLAGGKHIVYVKDVEDCTTEVEVIMPDPIVLNPKTEVNYDCANNAQVNTVTVTVDASNTDLSHIRYELDGDSTTDQASPIFVNVAPGLHYVIAIHENGCFQRSDDFIVDTVAPLTLALSAGQPEMNVISVTATGGVPAYEYSFNGESFTSENQYKIYKSGDYIVVVRDQNGCTATITVPMTYIDVCLDNYFTPNGDGIYDQWGPGCTNIYNNLLFSIFDRYGRVIAKYHYGQKWDGKYNGRELPSGDYWYVLKLNEEKDPREFVGHFTLYR